MIWEHLWENNLKMLGVKVIHLKTALRNTHWLIYILMTESPLTKDLQHRLLLPHTDATNKTVTWRQKKEQHIWSNFYARCANQRNTTSKTKTVVLSNVIYTAEGSTSVTVKDKWLTTYTKES
jgi:hypothetical protein